MESGPTTGFIARLGQQVPARRHADRLSVQQLADRSGINRLMLTQIELGQANPTLVTVHKVTRAQGVEPLIINPPGAATTVWSSDAGSHATLHVATTQRAPAELCAWVPQPNDSYDAQPDAPGSEELFLVLSSTLTIEVGDLEPVSVGASASARLASDRAYRYMNRTGRPVRVVQVAQ